MAASNLNGVRIFVCRDADSDNNNTNDDDNGDDNVVSVIRVDFLVLWVPNCAC